MPGRAADSGIWLATATDALVWAAANGDAVAAQALYAQLVKADGAVCHLRLAEASGLVAADASGGGHPGTISATGITYGLPSALLGDPADRAMGFDGITGQVDVAYAAALNPALWSIEGWWWEAVGQAGNNPIWDCRPASSGALAAGFDLFLNVGTGIGISVCSTNVAQTLVVYAVPNLLSTWHYTVATYDGAQARLYVDGVLHGGPTTCPYTPNPNKPAGVGRLTGGGNRVTGRLDEVALYPSVLTAAQVANHWLAGSLALGAAAATAEALAA